MHDRFKCRRSAGVTGRFRNQSGGNGGREHLRQNSVAAFRKQGRCPVIPEKRTDRIESEVGKVSLLYSKRRLNGRICRGKGGGIRIAERIHVQVHIA